MLAVGLAHVATASFLVSRTVPTGGFAVALAGGVALARAAQRGGLRQGYGVSIGAMLQTVAIMGPTRFGVPFTQAISAPIVGRLYARGHGFALQWLATSAVRMLHNVLSMLFYVFVLLGAEAYTGSYEELLGFLPVGPLVATALALLAWNAGASTAQVLVYRRGLERWPAGVARNPAPEPSGTGAMHGPEPSNPDAVQAPRSSDAGALQLSERPGRFDPRAVGVAMVMTTAVLLASTAWPVLGGVAAWLVLAWAAAAGDRSAVRAGLVIAAVLGTGTLAFGLIGGLGLELALRRTLRVVLLVLVATWLRAAAGREGLREVFRRTLHRLRAVPGVREAARVLDGLGSTGALAASGRQLLASLRPVPRRALPLLDAVLGWVARESEHHDADPPGPAPALRLRPVDALLVVAAAATALALLV